MPYQTLTWKRKNCETKREKEKESGYEKKSGVREKGEEKRDRVGKIENCCNDER